MTWLPRFTLRTLAIFTLLCTSGFGLWWRMRGAPWYLEHVFPEDRQGGWRAPMVSADETQMLSVDHHGKAFLWSLKTYERKRATSKRGLRNFPKEEKRKAERHP